MKYTSVVQARINNTLKQCVKREGLLFGVSRPQSITKPDNRLVQLLAGRPRVRLETDENGHAVVDKEKHPRLYEWAVKG